MNAARAIRRQREAQTKLQSVAEASEGRFLKPAADWIRLVLEAYFWLLPR